MELVNSHMLYFLYILKSGCIDKTADVQLLYFHTSFLIPFFLVTSNNL